LPSVDGEKITCMKNVTFIFDGQARNFSNIRRKIVISFKSFRGWDVGFLTKGKLLTRRKTFD